MHSLERHNLGRVMVACVFALLLVVGGAADAKKSKIKQANGRLMELNQEENTMTVRVKGKPVVFNVKIEGSVMTRTTSTMNAKPVKLADIPIKAPVIVYWVPDEKNPKEKFARKVDAPKVPKEWLEEME